MIKMRVLSDLHLDFDYEAISKLDTDSESVLIVAGDLCEVETSNDVFVRFFDDVSPRFKAIIYVLGNHEYYGSSLDDTLSIARHITSSYNNVFLLDRNSIIIEDTVFIGATLWSKVREEQRWTIQNGLNDYRLISSINTSTIYDICNSKTRITIDDTNAMHEADLLYIQQEVARHRLDKNIVVVTHHLPSYASVSEMYKNSELTPAYATELLEQNYWVCDIDYWIHGHTHTACDYETDCGIRVLCNPKGYPNDYSNYKDLVVDVS